MIWAAFLALASAQSISSGCLTALASVASDPSAAACLSPSPLISIFVSGSNESSVVTPVDTWLTGLCVAAPCSNSTISAITTNVTAGCPVELAAFGFQNITQAFVQQTYPVLIDVMCLQDNNDNGTLCVTQTLKNIEGVSGPVMLSNTSSLARNGIVNTLLSNNATCTNCIKQSYNLISQQAPVLLGNTTTASLQNTCGTSFVDGQTPTGISETSQATPPPSASNSALGLSLPQPSTLSVLVLILSVFAFFA